MIHLLAAWRIPNFFEYLIAELWKMGYGQQQCCTFLSGSPFGLIVKYLVQLQSLVCLPVYSNFKAHVLVDSWNTYAALVILYFATHLSTITGMNARISSIIPVFPAPYGLPLTPTLQTSDCDSCCRCLNKKCHKIQSLLSPADIQNVW